MKKIERRGFFGGAVAALGAGAVPLAAQEASGRGAAGPGLLPPYCMAQNYQSRKQSSFDQTGGNRDFWPVKAGATQELFSHKGSGVISHIWFTIASQSPHHLKELILRAYWDGSEKPAVEAPVGDFFGLNLGDYVLYENEYLACSPGKSLNCYFAMPYRKSARMTVTNQGTRDTGAFYSNIDYQIVDALPKDALYFQAQYRQAAPNIAVKPVDGKTPNNPDGKNNYVFCETRGRGHLMGVTLGVVQNSENWMGEGDDMIFIDDESKPAIVGTGSEDYFLGSWNFGGREGAKAFAYHMYGAPLIQSPERTGGRYCCYRFHGDNPVTYTKYLRHTIEHGHGNDRADCYYSCAYWYQDKPYTDFPALPPANDRIPKVVPAG
jgi:hypothetical protein